MTTPVEQLASALSDRYRIERELGQGGRAARSGDAPPRAPPRGYCTSTLSSYGEGEVVPAVAR